MSLILGFAALIPFVPAAWSFVQSGGIPDVLFTGDAGIRRPLADGGGGRETQFSVTRIRSRKLVGLTQIAASQDLVVYFMP